MYCLSHDDELDQIEAAVRNHHYAWIDMRGADDARIAEVGERLRLHELTIEDLQHFGQRAKIEDYPDYLHLVVWGAAPRSDADRLVEVHIVYSRDYMITFARDESAALDRVRRRIVEGAPATLSGARLLHAIVDALVDSYGPLLEDMDDEIDSIEDDIFERRIEGRERKIHMLRKRLARVDRVVHRQNEAFTRLHDSLTHHQTSAGEHAPYFRDVQDHLIRLAESTDALRERVSDISDIYMSALDTRQNVIMRQFTVTAGIFLPLTVLVGYFGQNFRWMTDHVAGWVSFAIFGVVLPIAITVALLIAFKRRGLLGGDAR